MATPQKIAIINASTVLLDEEVQAAVPALQKQISEHFEPAWDIDADLIFVSKSAPHPTDCWWLAILDSSDQAGALGYHDLTPTGMPLGKVFAGTDKQYGNLWTVTVSHELLEMLADPMINLSAMVALASGDMLVAYEVCDPCEADQFGYDIDGIKVSDFVLPAWFCPELAGQPGRKYDHMGHVDQPLHLIDGGYISVYRISSGNGWQQLYGEHNVAERRAFSQRAQLGSRRERRRVPHKEWIKSTPK